MIFLKCFSYRSHPLSSSPSCSLFFSCFYFLFLPFLPFLHIKLRTIRGKSVFWKLWINSESDLWLSTGSVCCCSVAKLCPTLCDLMACSPPGFSVHGISRGRILEWVVISFSRGSSWSKDQIHISCISRQILYHWATREAPSIVNISDQLKTLLSSSCVRTNSAYMNMNPHLGLTHQCSDQLWPNPEWESSLRAREYLTLSQSYLTPLWSVLDHDKLFLTYWRWLGQLPNFHNVGKNGHFNWRGCLCPHVT